jgi:hypothetical protein
VNDSWQFDIVLLVLYCFFDDFTMFGVIFYFSFFGLIIFLFVFVEVDSQLLENIFLLNSIRCFPACDVVMGVVIIQG